MGIFRAVDEPSKVVNRLVAVNGDNAKAQTIVEGADFYSSPRFDAKGEHLLWLEYVSICLAWRSGQCLK